MMEMLREKRDPVRYNDENSVFPNCQRPLRRRKALTEQIYIPSSCICSNNPALLVLVLVLVFFFFAILIFSEHYFFLRKFEGKFARNGLKIWTH
ncbi:hypothetical protein TorRG33x02_302190 [Trema orientale]|uniref:Transmembrane protein n=1 Tax=Trema orientale TaxID=63057 RepID=A0A2P5C0Q4_TREOI|nr:hypothetical protein TorRG33x02_302190 [Trema orientale]